MAQSDAQTSKLVHLDSYLIELISGDQGLPRGRDDGTAGTLCCMENDIGRSLDLPCYISNTSNLGWRWVVASTPLNVRSEEKKNCEKCYTLSHWSGPQGWTSYVKLREELDYVLDQSEDSWSKSEASACPKEVQKVTCWHLDTNSTSCSKSCCGQEAKQALSVDSGSPD
jgi:hypothetical protein